MPLAQFLGCVVVCLALTSCARASYGSAEVNSLKDVYGRHAEKLAKFSELANLAYAPARDIPDDYERREASFSALADTAVYLLQTDDSDKTQYISIRGTSNAKDAIVDAKADLVRDEILDIPVHKGFHALALAVYHDLQTSGRLRAGYRIGLTGHSLGGAAAVLLAMYLWKEQYAVSEVFTFGQPKVTTDLGARAFSPLSGRILRVVNCDDIIPFLPPPVLGRYQHVGSILLLLDGEYFDYVDQGDIERSFVGSLRQDVEHAVEGDKTFYGHRMKEYRRRIAAKAASYQPVLYSDRDPRFCGHEERGS